MSLLEPRCLVCGAPLEQGAIFEKDVRDSEVCSDECYDKYMYNEDTGHIESERCWCEPELEFEDPETSNQVWIHREIQ
jgi:hypothetical protein